MTLIILGRPYHVGGSQVWATSKCSTLDRPAERKKSPKRDYGLDGWQFVMSAAPNGSSLHRTKEKMSCHPLLLVDKGFLYHHKPTRQQNIRSETSKSQPHTDFTDFRAPLPGALVKDCVHWQTEVSLIVIHYCALLKQANFALHLIFLIGKRCKGMLFKGSMIPVLWQPQLGIYQFHKGSMCLLTTCPAATPQKIKVRLQRSPNRKMGEGTRWDSPTRFEYTISHNHYENCQKNGIQQANPSGA